MINGGLTLHLFPTYVDEFPRESLLETCSGVGKGVRGLSACSVIGTFFYESHLTRLVPSVPADATFKTEASGSLGTETLGKSLDGPRSPTEEEPGKGRAQRGTAAGTTGEKLYSRWDNLWVLGKSLGEMRGFYLVTRDAGKCVRSLTCATSIWKCAQGCVKISVVVAGIKCKTSNFTLERCLREISSRGQQSPTLYFQFGDTAFCSAAATVLLSVLHVFYQCNYFVHSDK